MSKLSEEKINEIKTVYAETRSTKETAKLCKVSQTTVYKYVFNRKYSNAYLNNKFYTFHLKDVGKDGRYKLTEDERYEINNAYHVEGYTMASLAILYGVSYCTIRRVCNDEYRQLMNESTSRCNKKRGSKSNALSSRKTYHKRKKVFAENYDIINKDS